jgi:N-methylhydantoinase A
MPVGALSAGDVAKIRADYDAEYARFYDRPVPGSDVEVMSFAVVVSTVVEAVEPVALPAAAPAPAPIRQQAVRDTASGAVADWAVYDRAAMPPGCRVPGPCIISEDETSTMVGPGWACAVDGLGYLELTRGDAA